MTRLWRLRANPLRRRSDVAEAWVALAAAVLVAVGAPAAGVAAGLSADAAVREELAGLRRVSAVLTEDARLAKGAAYSVEEAVKGRAEVRWTAPGGAPGSGVAVVAPHAKAGSRTVVWVDGDGGLRRDPPTHAQARAQGMATGAAAAGGVCLLAVGGWWCAREWLDRRREQEWEREWARCGPEWRRKPV
ncbi:Rv1733c family protein [Streptomyces capparidis]